MTAPLIIDSFAGGEVRPVGMTMCSGIGAPEMAAPWIDWRFASEVEPFPRAVLQQRLGYLPPEDHTQGAPYLHGDMTEITPDLLRARGIPLPDIIVAGTPCQAFSVAGARRGLEDARGNLTLTFLEICHAVVDARPDGRLAVLWENVPGVLSDRGNAFGCFLGGLVGAVDALVPSPCPGPGESTDHWKWHKGGRYEVLDDDGEPTGEWTIVEPHHRLSWPGEGMVEGPRARLAWSVLDAQWFGVAQRRRRVFVVVDFGGAIDPAAVLLEPDRLRGDHPPRRETGQRPAPTISARPTGGGGLGTDFDCDGGLIAMAHGQAGAEIARGHGPTLTCNHEAPIVAHALRGEGFDASEGGTGRGTPIAPVAFDCKGTEVQFTDEGSHPTLRSMGHSASHQNAGGHAAVAWALGSHAGSADGDQTNRSHALGGPVGIGIQEGIAYSLRAGREQSIATPWSVRRLTPTECARLQGFSDNHTRIEWAGKPADQCPDGPQYKAYGNSMAVPVVRWILGRMAANAGWTAALQWAGPAAADHQRSASHG